MSQLIVGSKMPDFASDVKISNLGYGQGGSACPSSLTPGQARKVTATYAKLAVDSTNVKVDPGDWQMRTISAAPLKPAFAQTSPNKSPARIPDALNRGSVPVSVRPATRGNMKR
jgi:hypothetical protein